MIRIFTLLGVPTLPPPNLSLNPYYMSMFFILSFILLFYLLEQGAFAKAKQCLYLRERYIVSLKQEIKERDSLTQTY